MTDFKTTVDLNPIQFEPDPPPNLAGLALATLLVGVCFGVFCTVLCQNPDVFVPTGLVGWFISFVVCYPKGK